MNDKDLQYQIEELIDATTLDRVLNAISVTCAEKAEHVQSNWQDRNLAKAWESCMKAVDKAHAKAVDMGL